MRRLIVKANALKNTGGLLLRTQLLPHLLEATSEFDVHVLAPDAVGMRDPAKMHLVSDHRSALRLGRKLAAERPDAIGLSLDNVLLEGKGFARNVMLLHNAWVVADDPDLWRLSSWRDRLWRGSRNVAIRRSIRLADAIVVQTEWFAKAVADRFPSAARPILGSSVISFDAVQPEPPGLDLSPPVIAWVGGPYTHKMAQSLPAVLRELDALGVKGTLAATLYGRGMSPIAKACAEVGGSVRFVNAGRLSNSQVHGLFQASQVALFTSRLETIGIAYAEAAMHGCHVVAADIPAVRELLPDHAARFPRGDAKRAAEEVARAIERPRPIELPPKLAIGDLMWRQTAATLFDALTG